MRNGYIINALTLVDIQGIVKIGGKVFQIFEAVFSKENFKISPFKKVIEKLFAPRSTYKDENIDVMQLLLKLIMNSLYGEQVRKDIEQCFASKSEAWMMSEYDERVIDFWKIGYGKSFVKMIDEIGLKDDVKK